MKILIMLVAIILALLWLTHHTDKQLRLLDLETQQLHQQLDTLQSRQHQIQQQIEAFKIVHNQRIKILQAIYFLESTNGKHDFCGSAGYNGYGYGHQCYDSHEEVSTIVYNWIAKRLPNMSEAQLLCFYNLGTKVNDCPYYRKYLSI